MPDSGIAGGAALRAAEIFRGVGQFAKQVRWVIDAFGLVNLLLRERPAIHPASDCQIAA